MQRSTRVLLVVSVLLCAAAAGFYSSRALSPERVRTYVEDLLAKVTRAPVEIATLRLVWGFPIRLEGTGVRLYQGALTVESASARIDALALLLGRPGLSLLRLDGAHLRMDRSPQGEWQPPIFGASSPPGTEQLTVTPLGAIEQVARALLSRPLLADTLIVRRSRVEVTQPSPAGDAQPFRLEFGGVNGRLMHSRLFGEARLYLAVRVESGERDLGRIEWEGSRDPHGTLHATMAATGLDLSTFSPYLRGVRPTARLSGTLDGVAEFQTSTPGVEQLDLDLAVRNVEASLGASAETATAR